MRVFVPRPMKIVTFPWKNGDPKNWLLIFFRKNTFRKIMEIVEEFVERSYNNNGKPWTKNLGNLKRFLHFSSFSSCFFIFHFSVFFLDILAFVNIFLHVFDLFFLCSFFLSFFHYCFLNVFLFFCLNFSFFHVFLHFFHFSFFPIIFSILSFSFSFRGNSQNLRNFPHTSPDVGGLATPFVFGCLITRFIDVYLGPSVQPIPPVFV